MNVLLIGAGYSARAFARLLPEGTVVTGTTRSADKTAALEADGMSAIVFDGTAISPALAEAMGQAELLVVSAAPGPQGDPFLNALGTPLKAAMPRLQWAGYLSTVGVYGDHQGAWVTEASECRAKPGRSDNRLTADEAWLAAGAESGVPVAVLRLSGIYGPGRNAFVNLEAGTARRIVKAGQVFNRIHVDDIAGALLHLAGKLAGGVFNVSDDEPAPPQDVVAYAAGVMGVTPPDEVAFETVEMSPMALSFWGEVKRVSNAKLRATGYDFVHPTYRAALDAMWRSGTWRR